METKNLTLTVLGIVIITAIVGLVLLFTMANTGAGVYGGALKGDPFPYTRYIEGQAMIETPGWETTLIEPSTQIYGGATETLVDLTEVPREVQKDVVYKRDPYAKTRTAKISCSVLKFPSNVYAPNNVNVQQWQSYIGMGRTCFTETIDGTPVRDILGDFACCRR
ncbi:hypothetical protein KY328_01065 [Candidatus Woesearchaeota archaeon]|nr:hypothetical protein [Candidatus Woesearchaeota archaeon]MBW3021487.1 hypothetical protein [Candidatus Woesearchaeota archaeon]